MFRQGGGGLPPSPPPPLPWTSSPPSPPPPPAQASLCPAPPQTHHPKAGRGNMGRAVVSGIEGKGQGRVSRTAVVRGGGA